MIILRRRKMFKVSIILPLYNSEKFIESCFNSLLNQTFKNYELIILDDCSTDKTREILDKKNIKYYKNEKNLGFPSNLNKGLKMAKGDYIMIVDQDMVYDKNYLRDMMSDPKDIMAGRCYYYAGDNLKGRTIRGFGIKVNLFTGKTTVHCRDRYDYNFDYPNLIRIKSAGCGTLVFKKEVFNKVKFDENLYKYYVDIDFCYKAKEHGFKMFLSKAKCWHKKEKKDVFDKEELKKYYQDKKRFLKKHSPCYPLCLTLIKIKQMIL